MDAALDKPKRAQGEKLGSENVEDKEHQRKR